MAEVEHHPEARNVLDDHFLLAGKRSEGEARHLRRIALEALAMKGMVVRPADEVSEMVNVQLREALGAAWRLLPDNGHAAYAVIDAALAEGPRDCDCSPSGHWAGCPEEKT